MLKQDHLSIRLINSIALIVLLVLGVGSLASPLAGQSPEDAEEPGGTTKTDTPTSTLRIAGMTVTPENPGSETLCTLTVQLENNADKPAYSLVFEVEVGGASLPVYEKQVYMVPIHPSGKTASNKPQTTELRLFNFWTSDSRRERPADGKLDVTVKLIEAQWLTISEETSEDGKPVEVWTPAGAVTGLPSEVSATLELEG